MSVTVDATVGGAAANSYLSVADAGTLLNNRLGIDAWTAASTDDKGRALIMATMEIDSLPLSGFKMSSTQALMFPRTTQVEATDQIPVQIQRACAAQALWALQHSATGGRSERQQLIAEGVTQYTIGSLSENLRGAGAAANLCGEAQRHLRGWISRLGTTIGPREESIYGYTGWNSGPFAP